MPLTPESGVGASPNDCICLTPDISNADSDVPKRDVGSENDEVVHRVLEDVEDAIQEITHKMDRIGCFPMQPAPAPSAIFSRVSNT